MTKDEMEMYLIEVWIKECKPSVEQVEKAINLTGAFSKFSWNNWNKIAGKGIVKAQYLIDKYK